MAAQAAADAQALADALGEEGVRDCLELCGLTTDAQKQGWIDEGMSDMEGILTIRPSEVSQIGEELQKLPLNRGGSRQGKGTRRKVQALVRWCMERKARGQNLDSRLFTRDVMLEMAEKIRIEEDEKDAGIEAVENTVKFKPQKWVQWKLGFKTAIGQLRGINNSVPLTYIIRKREVPRDIFQFSREEQELYVVQLTGPAFKSDNRTVWNRLKMELIDTDGWAWIQQFEKTSDGRAAWLKLCDHYDGPGETERRIAEANKTLANATYKSEKYGMKFETYSTKIMDALTVLQDNGIVKNGTEQVAYLLDGISPNAPQYVQHLKTFIRMNQETKSDFTEAANRMAEMISQESNNVGGHGQGGGRRISAFDRGGRSGGRGGRGRGRGRGGRGRGRGRGQGRGNNDNTNDTRMNVGGVDVRDPTREFSREEYGTLIEEGYVGTLKRRRQEARGNGGGDDASTAISSLRTENETLTARIAALEGAYRGHSESNSQAGGSGGSSSNQPQSNGTAFGAGAYKRRKTGDNG